MSPREESEGEPRNKPLASKRDVLARIEERRCEHARGTAERRTYSKRSGMGMQESESLIVPTKPGNRRSTGLGGGKGRPGE
jgi:hypothetical protein